MKTCRKCFITWRSWCQSGDIYWQLDPYITLKHPFNWMLLFWIKLLTSQFNRLFFLMAFVIFAMPALISLSNRIRKKSFALLHYNQRPGSSYCKSMGCPLTNLNRSFLLMRGRCIKNPMQGLKCTANFPGIGNGRNWHGSHPEP